MDQIAVPAKVGNHKTSPSCNFLSSDQERRLIERWQKHRDLAARTQLVEAFLPLLQREAKLFMREKRLRPDVINKRKAKSHECARGVFYELVGVGLGGLDTARDQRDGVTRARGFLCAIEKFDLSTPHRLSTYAMPWIRAALGEWYRLECHRGVKGAPRGSAFIKTADIHHVLGVDEGGKSITVESTIADEHDFADTSEAESESAALHECLRSLDERERRIIEARHLDHARPATFAGLGEELRFSGERARQLEARALEKLQNARKLVTSGSYLWPATPRWNSLGLEKPLKRWSIPNDILKLAETEPCKPDWWRNSHPSRPFSLWKPKSYPCWDYSPDEVAAFMASHPDLLQSPKHESKRDWEWWHKHAVNCAYWALNDSFGGYAFEPGAEGPPPYERWPSRHNNIIPFPRTRIRRANSIVQLGRAA